MLIVFDNEGAGRRKEQFEELRERKIREHEERRARSKARAEASATPSTVKATPQTGKRAKYQAPEDEEQKVPIPDYRIQKGRRKTERMTPARAAEEEPKEGGSKERPKEGPKEPREMKGGKFARPSNKKLIKNAVGAVCMAGEHNKKEREEIHAAIEASGKDNFCVLFKSALGR